MNAFLKSLPVNVTLTLLMSCFTSIGLAQQVFDLRAPGRGEISQAIVQEQAILIRDAGGNETLYRRESNFNSQDGQWIGYYSRNSRQALQWPIANQGPMRIGSRNAGNQWAFRTSQMQIYSTEVVPPGIGGLNSWADRAIDSSVADPFANSTRRGYLPEQDPWQSQDLQAGVSTSLLPFNGNSAPIPIHLGIGDTNRRRYLARTSMGRLGVVQESALQDSTLGGWYIVPLSNGLARVQYYGADNQWQAMGYDPVLQQLGLMPLDGRADLLWRISNCQGTNGAYMLESLAFPGQCLTYQQNSIGLAPITYSPYQQWWPSTPNLAMVQPLYRTVSQHVVPNPPLPPANVQLINTHNETLIVLVADRRGGGAYDKLRIPVGASETVTLQRDSGGTIVETCEVRTPYGDWDRREFSTPIPPATIYDISVYEEFLQSIAIDRTGSSPNPIEDINYQPRSLGLFLVPPGNQLPLEATIDTYRTAKQARNSGAVRRLSPEDYQNRPQDAPVDPLRDILREFEGKRAAF